MINSPSNPIFSFIIRSMFFIIKSFKFIIFKNTYVFIIDTANMVNDDIIEIRAKTKVTTGDTSQLAYFAVYAHTQSTLNKYSVPIPVDIELIVTLKRVNGTDRTYIWTLLELE